MAVQSVIVVQGKKYISSKTASKIWGLSQKTIAKYCREKRIRDCFKGAYNCWYISIDTIKPLSDNEVHQILCLTLQLKNDPSFVVDWSPFDFDISLIELIYQNLADEGYLKPFHINSKERIPYEVILTQKGFHTALPLKKQKSEISFPDLITQWAPTIISTAQFVIQMAQILSTA